MSTQKDIKKTGKEFIKSIMDTIPYDSGIYKMIDSKNQIIYIGKAKNLNNRVSSYSSKTLLHRTAIMVSLINDIQWITTKDEQDALLLEADLIKHFKPRYNILLKDDKTFPFIKLDTTLPYPRITKFRTKQAYPGEGMFGPYAASAFVDENINTIQKTFLLRTCSDKTFSVRKTACILYQIKRCSAPCVQKISQSNYRDSVKQAISFLNGNNHDLKNALIKQMTTYSEAQNFEQALIYRDRIKALNIIAASQSILLNTNEDSDFIAILQQNNTYIFKIFMFKQGHNYGSLDFFSPVPLEEQLESDIESLLIQFYSSRNIPDNIYLNILLPKDTIKYLENILNAKKKAKVKIKNPLNNKKNNDIINLVIKNAEASLVKYQEANIKWEAKFQELEAFFNITNKIHKIEVYDNSHLYGTFPLGVMICAKISGFDKNEYRVFKFKNPLADSRDDYAILKETLHRRFTRALKEKQELPELVLIDGGKGQLSASMEVFQQLNITTVKLVGVAKGVNRNAGEETLFFTDGTSVQPDKYSPVLHFIQMLRNEVHRFAVTNVNKHKIKSLSRSSIEKIPNIGNKRKQELLNYFGSFEKIQSASVDELKKVNGINSDLAIKIFNWFH